MPATDVLRLFIAIEFPAVAKMALATEIKRLQAVDRGHSVRWTAVDNLHLTLKFLGDTPAERVPHINAAIEQATAGIAPFSVSVGGAGVFPNPRAPRILWIGVGGEVATLLRLQASIERHIAPLGYLTESRPFSAHVTIGRVKPEARRDAIRPIVDSASQVRTDLAAWQVDHVALMQSDLQSTGVVYTRISAFRLSSAAR